MHPRDHLRLFYRRALQVRRVVTDGQLTLLLVICQEPRRVWSGREVCEQLQGLIGYTRNEGGWLRHALTLDQLGLAHLSGSGRGPGHGRTIQATRKGLKLLGYHADFIGEAAF